MKVVQEADLVPQRRIVSVAIGTILVTALGVGVAWWLTDCRSAELGASQQPGVYRSSRPAPEQVNNIELIPFGRPAVSERLERTKQERLGQYGWVDPQQGIIHMPIDKAVELYLRQGGLAPALRPPEQPADKPLPDEKHLLEPAAARIETKETP